MFRLANLQRCVKLLALRDSNFECRCVLTPSARTPVFGLPSFEIRSDADCLVSSQGYFLEIRKAFSSVGFDLQWILSSEEFMV